MLTETASQHINPMATSASAANTLTIRAVYQTRGLAQSENAPDERRSSWVDQVRREVAKNAPDGRSCDAKKRPGILHPGPQESRPTGKWARG
jgi:hypothetical protein